MKRQNSNLFKLANQWNWTIIFAPMRKDEDFLDKVAEANTFGHCELSLEGPEDLDAPCTLTDIETMTMAVFVRPSDRSFQYNSTASLIAHELIHVLTTMSECSGCKINDETTECWAYCMMSLFQQCESALAKMKKD